MSKDLEMLWMHHDQMLLVEMIGRLPDIGKHFDLPIVTAAKRGVEVSPTRKSSIRSDLLEHIKLSLCIIKKMHIDGQEVLHG
ncbi:MAG: hypothetical protein D4Q77_03465 [Methanothrix sp.]|nr:MAG: hypothetical protein D4Q77_03465 [Methanothrix sp.]